MTLLRSGPRAWVGVRSISEKAFPSHMCYPVKFGSGETFGLSVASKAHSDVLLAVGEGKSRQYSRYLAYRVNFYTRLELVYMFNSSNRRSNRHPCIYCRQPSRQQSSRSSASCIHPIIRISSFRQRRPPRLRTSATVDILWYHRIERRSNQLVCFILHADCSSAHEHLHSSVLLL